MKKESLISSIDGAIQKCVDATAHLLMRRLGTTLHWIQFSTFVVIISADLFKCACYAVQQEQFGLVMHIIGAAWMMTVAQRLANRIPAVPPKDLYSSLPPVIQAAYPMLKAATAFLLITSMYFLVLTANKPSVIRKVYDLPIEVSTSLSSLAIFFCAYLIRTPNEPPPEKKKEPKGVLVPQRSET